MTSSSSDSSESEDSTTSKATTASKQPPSTTTNGDPELPWAIHDAGAVVPVPAQRMFSYNMPMHTRAMVAAELLAYGYGLKANLAEVLTMPEDERSFWEGLYDAEIAKNAAFLLPSGTTPARCAGTARQWSSSHSKPGIVKASLPEKFAGKAEKLQLFKTNMLAYFSVTNVPEDKQADVLRLNLTDPVCTTLMHTHINDTTFWSNVNNVFNALEQLYCSPNRQSNAQIALRNLKMQGYKLMKFFNSFITLCGEAGYDPDSTQCKMTFYLGLNNTVTRGGLRCQVMHLTHDTSKTIRDILVLSDLLLQAEHGANYESKHCPADSDEHANVTYGTADNGRGSWTRVNNKKRPRDNNSAGGNNNNSYKKPTPNDTTTNNNGAANKQAKWNKNSTNNNQKYKKSGAAGASSTICTRCKRAGHTVDTCNARYTKDTENELPIETSANFKQGKWKAGDKYPVKKVDNTSVNTLSTMPTTLTTPAPPKRTITFGTLETVLEENEQVLHQANYQQAIQGMANVQVNSSLDSHPLACEYPNKTKTTNAVRCKK